MPQPDRSQRNYLATPDNRAFEDYVRDKIHDLNNQMQTIVGMAERQYAEATALSATTRDEVHAITELISASNAKIDSIMSAITGGSDDQKPGIKGRLRAVEAWLETLNKLVWIAVGASVTGLVMSLIKMLQEHGH